MYSKIERLRSTVIAHPTNLEKAIKNHSRMMQVADNGDPYGNSKGSSVERRKFVAL